MFILNHLTSKYLLISVFVMTMLCCYMSRRCVSPVLYIFVVEKPRAMYITGKNPLYIFQCNHPCERVGNYFNKKLHDSYFFGLCFVPCNPVYLSRVLQQCVCVCMLYEVENISGMMHTVHALVRFVVV